MNKLTIVGLLLLCAGVAKADSLANVTQEIKHSSLLVLRNDVAQDFAENLLAAQQPGVCSYCAFEPDSLQLSIDAVLRAIALEQSLNGARYCDDNNCQFAWQQSNIAIDDRVMIGITPSAINFGEVGVSTPEPSVLVLCLAGLLWALAFSSKPVKQREYLASHPFRK